MTHPYQSLPKRNFWRSGVAEVNPLEWTDLYYKRFEIAPSDGVASAGSCFAQHIGRQLAQRKFRYLDFEPPPEALPKKQRASFGYGLFSARYGNIYTARQLRQLMDSALGAFTPEVQVWEKDGRFFDPYRPSIEQGGFSSAEEAIALRQRQHLPAVRRLFSETDLFIFTLGLTEGWISKRDGAVFPICPGVIAGDFDASEHAFHNFTYPEIFADMCAVIERARSLNSAMRFLITVSPVPLTATATDQHVLSAATYSKSVLRAVAGDLYAKYPFVDYFPSYEIITAPATRGVFYEPNLREVSPAAVNVVMSHFFREHAAPSAKPADAPARASAAADEADILCDEEKLDPVRG